MKKRIGCLHAHYTNIDYIEQALSSYEVELLHFVDPALVFRVSSDVTFSPADAEQKVREQIEWIAQAHVDAILITCTNYIAMLDEEQLSITVPIIKIDEPLFSSLCRYDQPQILLFTNPATVEGTMNRLNEHALALGKQLQVDVRIIPEAFELIMLGKKEKSRSVVSEYIQNLRVAETGKPISVAQLSMVEAAKLVQQHSGVAIGNPLAALVSYMEDQLFK